jgi:hypothetical protein
MKTINTDFPQVLIPSDGHTTNLAHRQWEWTMNTMLRCTICGGLVNGAGSARSLCAARQALGQPTPVLDCTPRCQCMPCKLARQGGAA